MNRTCNNIQEVCGTSFWQSSTSFDLNDLLTLGSSIAKATSKLKSNPRSLTNSKKWSTRSSAVQWPTNKVPQYNVTILRNFFEKKLTYPSYCFFTWEFVFSSNLKEYGVFCTSVLSSSLTNGARPNWTTYLDFVSSWEYFAAICKSGNIFWICYCHYWLKRMSDFYSPCLEPARFLYSKFGLRCRFGTSC